MADSTDSNDERPCLHCLIGDLIDEFYAEYGSLSGEKDTVDVDEIITALAKTVAEMTFGSDAAVRQRILEDLVREISQFEAEYASHTGRELKARDILLKMREGDPLCRLLWRRYVDRAARGLSVVVNTLDPDIFVMGGGMSNVDELYVDLPPKLAEYTFSPVFETPIRKAKHGDSSGVRGAAWLWKDN